MDLSEAQLEQFFKLIKEHSGIFLTKDKTYLIESRLSPLVRKHKFSHLNELITKFIKCHDDVLFREVIDVMTTKESYFFRDIVPFDRLANFVIPKIIERDSNKKTIKIWCAACSTGQEPYSIAMMIKEKLYKTDVNFEIVATDISSFAIEKAKSGIYSQFEVQRGLSVSFLLKYFEQQGDKIWQINESIRSMVNFSVKNLLDCPTTYLDKYDIIFCRNVLIYFDYDTKIKVLNLIKKSLYKDGFLFLGTAETMIGVESVFKPVVEKNFSGIFAVT